MSVYFIHAEVLNGGNVVTKVCAIGDASSPQEAFDWFFESAMVEKYESDGRDVIIDKFEKVE
ncbi:hypothetical protein KGB36_gp39 [Shigella phage Sf11 SMD-2017]|uniref:Uncharacterized protein n=1 Tax=Shigella phage Sf11 SMD-2017 TaxID=2282196 RepID=A0A291AXK5_9CAUD|nr:hypothetical protein KGB36_gp39 [Shigella phage Sf11 SMD-2017]ATE85713.1 hypothetical protein Sf11_gp66 [Shigella phage Sf11 SMD-2017]